VKGAGRLRPPADGYAAAMAPYARTLARGVRDAGMGAIATVPMSAVMLAGQRLGWMREQPPEHVTGRAIEGVAGNRVLDRELDVAAAAVHVASGAVFGAAYGWLGRRLRSTPPAGLGVAFAVAIWAFSYRGWMPAIGVLPPEQRGARATAVMVAAHVAYGLALGRLAQRGEMR
jgi:hypothetical protein